MVDTGSYHILLGFNIIVNIVKVNIQVKITRETKSGTFTTKYKVESKGLKLPQLNRSTEVAVTFHLF